MSEKQTPSKEKTEGHTSSGDKKEEKTSFMNTQNILAILLIISLIGIAYLFTQLSACTSQGGGITIPTTTTTTIPISGNRAALGDVVKVDYIGKFVNGTLFDTSIESEAQKAGIYLSAREYEPLSVVIGQNQTLEGFEKGLIGMRVGETKTITIPAGEGYTTGALGNKVLVFTVTMVEITPKGSIPVVSAIVINDKRCAECAEYETAVVAQLKTLFANLKVTSLDYSSAEGKKIYTENGLTTVPAILFTSDVKDAAGYTGIQQYLDPAGRYLSLRIGAEWNPSAEICDNSIDDDGNGQIDCLDDGCKNKAACRQDIKNNVQVFIMSDCPYGREAVKALKEVVDNMGKELTYDVHYIVTATGNGGFASLHGDYEVKEDIVQLCVKKHSPEAWLSYIYCRSTNGVNGKDWKTCADSSKVNKSAVQACADGSEGSALLGEDMKIAEALNIGASPTWLANNRYEFSGISAEVVKTNICKYNANLSGCSKSLNSTSAVSGQC